VLRIRRARTSSYHPASNGQLERWHRNLHDGMSHYVNANHTNWDTVLCSYLMAYLVTPHSTTGYSPFFMHGREMTLPCNEEVRPKVPRSNVNYDQRVETLKQCLKRAYQSVGAASRSRQKK
jgi:hypothetical protein